MKISDNERMVLNRFNDEKQFYSFWDGGYKAEDSGTYASEFILEMSNAMGKPESSAKTALTNMIKKGIFKASDVAAEDPITAEDGTEVQPGKPADRWIELTEAGVELIADLRLEEDEAMLDLDVEEDDDDEPEMQTKSIAAQAADARIKAAREAQGRKAAAKADIADGKPGLRTSHANCDHPTQGKEGKMARAKCRRERAAAAKALEEKEAKKAERAAKKAAAHA